MSERAFPNRTAELQTSARFLLLLYRVLSSTVALMAPAKAVAWPDEIYNDDEVLSLDAQGRSIVCRICTESFAIYGGKVPKPVVMNSCFRTCAWETHKRRTRAHPKPPITSTSAVTIKPSTDPLLPRVRQFNEKLIHDANVFMQQAAAFRRANLQGFNSQYTPFTVMNDLTFNDTYGSLNVSPEPG